MRYVSSCPIDNLLILLVGVRRFELRAVENRLEQAEDAAFTGRKLLKAVDERDKASAALWAADELLRQAKGALEGLCVESEAA